MSNIDFLDKGKWVVIVNVMVNGEKKDIKFDVDVVSVGLKWVVIGGFIGVVVVIIIVVVVKKKSIK